MDHDVRPDRLADLVLQIVNDLRLAALLEQVRPGLTTSQILLLLTLEGSRGLPVSRVAVELGVSLPTVTGVADRLHRARLVHRRRSVRDRRTVLLRLSPEGERVVVRLRQVLEGAIDRVLGRLPPARASAIAAALAEVAALSALLRAEQRAEAGGAARARRPPPSCGPAHS